MTLWAEESRQGKTEATGKPLAAIPTVGWMDVLMPVAAVSAAVGTWVKQLLLLYATYIWPANPYESSLSSAKKQKLKTVSSQCHHRVVMGEWEKIHRAHTCGCPFHETGSNVSESFRLALSNFALLSLWVIVIMSTYRHFPPKLFIVCDQDFWFLARRSVPFLRGTTTAARDKCAVAIWTLCVCVCMFERGVSGHN